MNDSLSENPSENLLETPLMHSEAHTRLLAVSEHLQARLVGHEQLVERLIIALLTGGHLLIEGPPGTAKTRTIRQFAALIDVDFVRIQATPDLLPADITGSEIYRQNEAEFRFLPGPVFNPIVLVDEINRAPPKVQSALLEAMGEHQVTIGGVTRALPEPFLVAATQNPIEHEGTYPLPEAQLDRFMFQVELDLPDITDERRILDTVLGEDDGSIASADNAPPADADCIARAREAVSHIHIAEPVRDYIVRLVSATRGKGPGGHAAGDIAQASSPRGSICLARAAQARGWLAGRDFATPDDVSDLAGDVLAGRIALDYRARAEGRTTRGAIAEIVAATPRL